MRIVVFLMWFIPLSLLVWHLATKKYLNPYKLYFIVGMKGSGKSTDLAKRAIWHLNHGWKVFTTEHIPGTYQITADDIGKTEFPRRSVLFIDEASLYWDNRQFKSMPQSTIEWFRLQRHRHIKVFLYSQTFDVDIKIRNLADEMYLLKKSFRVFSYGKRILKKPDLVKPSAEAPACLQDVLEFDSLLFFWAGSRTLTYIPKYIYLFDSFKAEKLREREFELIPMRKPPTLKEHLRNSKIAVKLLISDFAVSAGKRLRK